MRKQVSQYRRPPTTQHATCVLPSLVSPRVEPSSHASSVLVCRPIRCFNGRPRTKKSEAESRWGSRRVGEWAGGWVRCSRHAPLPARPASSNEFSSGTMTGRSTAPKKKTTLPPTTSWLTTVKTSQTTQDYLTITSLVGDTWRGFFFLVLHQVTSNNQHNKSNSIK